MYIYTIEGEIATGSISIVVTLVVATLATVF